MQKVILAKACKRRVKGAPMIVTERAAYFMMQRGEAAIDKKFMADFAKEHRLPLPKAESQPGRFKKAKKDKGER